MTLAKPKIFFIGVARQCAAHLPYALNNLDRYANLTSASAGLIIENDSTDDTKSILKEWARGKQNFHVVTLDGIGGIAVRGLRLELIRNYCIDLAKTLGAENFDLIVIMDLDDVSAYPVKEEAFLSAVGFLMEKPSRAAVFPNQLGLYYDLWTLRHPERCPVDCWEEQFDAVVQRDMSDEEAFDATFRQRTLSISEFEEPFEVESAFGGLGIYKAGYALGNPNPYLGSKVRAFPPGHKLHPFVRLEVCEHVHFNQGIRSMGGELFIFPSLINGSTEGFFLPPPHTFRQFIFR